jgi:acyl transferase domain-containing protein
MGDRIEVGALKAVYLDNRTAGQTCWLSSVKPNIGHLEAASGAASLIKTVLSLQHRQIPPHVHCEHINAQLGLQGTPFEIPVVCQPWLSSTDRRFAGVSSFGFGGTNAHVILEEALPASNETRAQPLYFLTLSAQTKEALRDLVTRYVAFLRTAPAQQLTDVCFSANTGRSHFGVRLAAITRTTEQLSDQLESFLARGEAPNVVTGDAERRSARTTLRFDLNALDQMASAYVQGVVIDWSSYSHDCPGSARQAWR